MLPFGQFIVENTRRTTREEILSAVEHYKKVGEIINPEYVTLKSEAGRIFGKDEEVVRSAVLKIMHKSDHGNRDPQLNEIYYDLPHDLRGLGKLQKLILKLEKGNPSQEAVAVIPLCNNLIHNWKGIAADIAALKDKVVKVTQKREEAKIIKQKDMQSKFADSSSLIKIFESHLQEYKDMAEKRAREFINEKIKVLKDAGWDLHKIAPSPRSDIGRNAYQAAMQRRSLYLSLTKSTNASKPLGDPTDIRVLNKEMVDRYIKIAVDGAEASYREFMQKMITKIGKPVIHAEMTGNIWTNAILDVTTNDGETQKWKTKMIINYSRYQLMFNQFPTTKLK